jgi:hypothetical protein
LIPRCGSIQFHRSRQCGVRYVLKGSLRRQVAGSASRGANEASTGITSAPTSFDALWKMHSISRIPSIVRRTGEMREARIIGANTRVNLKRTPVEPKTHCLGSLEGGGLARSPLSYHGGCNPHHLLWIRFWLASDTIPNKLGRLSLPFFLAQCRPGIWFFLYQCTPKGHARRASGRCGSLDLRPRAAAPRRHLGYARRLAANAPVPLRGVLSAPGFWHSAQPHEAGIPVVLGPVC